jgi:hypothetical protein
MGLIKDEVGQMGGGTGVGVGSGAGGGSQAGKNRMNKMATRIRVNLLYIALSPQF